MITERLKSALDASGIQWSEQVSLRSLSTFRVGGAAELVVYPSDAQQLCRAIRLIRDEDLLFEVIGRGSNLLFCDGILEGALILTERLSHVTVEGERILCEAGATLASIACRAAEESLTGFEFARGIPGSLGGAIFMNAGAYGGEISSCLVESRAFDVESGRILTVTEHGFGYRHSAYIDRPEWICLGGQIRLSRGDRSEIEETMRELGRKRNEKQPTDRYSAGSYFKRPQGYFAGKLIEDCGLKGFSVGDAQVSEKHAGFVINRGEATAADVLRLEEKVKERVLAEFGVELEREVRFLR